MPHPPQTEVLDMEAIARTMERIRGERDTLRIERDSLRRNFDFFKVETRFTIESLQQQLQAALTAPTSSQPSQPTTQHTHASRVAMVSILVAHHLQSQQEVDAARISVLSRSAHLAQQRMEAGEERLREKDIELRKIRAEDVEMRDSLTMAEVKLANSETKMGDFTTLVTRLEQDLQQERTDHVETGAALAQAESQISDLEKALNDSESQRSSLILQVTHLEQDLGNVKSELEEAEGRYRTLQQQQLAAMSAGQATKALRNQIEDLEARVLRRTEQIGIHQHDIKKLEMNLRLQEERVAELTADIDVLETEKTAMVEDCRTTREERDMALRRCEELEENVEMLEAVASNLEEKRSTELQGMVSVVSDGIAKRRAISRSLSLATTTYEAKQRQFTTQLRLAEERDAVTRFHAERLSSEQNSVFTALQEANHRLQASQRAERDAYIRSREAIVALATVYTGLQATNASLSLVRSSRTSLHAQLGAVRQELEQKLSELSVLRTQYETLRSSSTEQHTKVQSLHAAQVAKLEERYQSLRTANEDLETRHRQTLSELSRAQDQIRLHVSDSVGHVQEEDALRIELQNIQQRYQGEADGLRAELAKTTEELEAAQLKQSELQSAHRQELDDISSAREELQQSLAEAFEKLDASRKIEAELLEAQNRHSAEIDTLQERLDVATKSLEQITNARDELLSEHGSAFKELEAKRAEAEALLRAKEDLEMQVANAQTCHSAELKIFEERVETATIEKAEVQSSLADVEVRLDELGRVRDELGNRISKADAEVERLRVELKAESEQRARDAEQHAADLQAARELGSKVQLGNGELQDELALLREQLRETEASVQAVREEKLHLQTQMTELEADIQRSLSLQRHQESQIQDGHKQISALQEQVERTRADYIRADTASKTAEINLSLQAVQHEKIVSTLRKELEALQEVSKLEETVIDLREKNEEMEELLRAKCLEIEENDDRFIELIKEKKKLTSKVESLTRKIKSLQDKLAGSRDSTPKANPLSTTHSNPPVAPVASTSTSTVPAPAPAPAPTPTPSLPAPPLFNPPASTAHIRASTTPTSISRPKTPEARAPPTVFKARTPESRRKSSHRPAPESFPTPPKATFRPLQEPFTASVSTSSTIGKKRRAPDDFEDCEGVPPQVFTADSIPSTSQENPNTPRVRRALQSARAGFTPVRGTRPIAQHPVSPPRAMGAAPLIADVTNSPRSKAAQKSKRGWLGSLRGGSSQASRAVSSSRTVLDRTQNAR